ncbi:MAG: hypothetical protein AAF197_08095 [Pseudomonadota bacterium]
MQILKLIALTASFIFVLLLAGCDLGGSSSGADQVPSTEAGNMIPAEFVGTYIGTLNLEADGIGISERDSFPIMITVTADGMLRFDGDDPDETFTVGVANDGRFSGNLRIDDDDVEGVLGVSGQVDGTTASGTVTGEGEVDTGLITIAVDVTGDFNATKQ